MTGSSPSDFAAACTSLLRDGQRRAQAGRGFEVSGRLTRVAGLVMECVGLKLAVGSACMIPVASGARIEAEVVGFEGDRLFLMPQSDVEGVVPGSRVFPVEASVPKPGTVAHPRRRPMDRAAPILSSMSGPPISPNSSAGRPPATAW